jgi:hypothetical protein
MHAEIMNISNPMLQICGGYKVKLRNLTSHPSGACTHM